MIKVENISKHYKLYSHPIERLKEIFLKKKYHYLHQALSQISFNVAEGETLGIIGKNGAGKSTLLKLLVGVALPDEGSIHIDGKITGLLELGTGFDYNLTGLQNIEVNGLLVGMTETEIKQRQQQIIDFSELGHYIKEPIRTYSSGMVMRLAFSIAIYAQPQCFVIDEALSVGDAHFQQKCMRKIQNFKEQGGSIIFVSHDLNAVKMLCDRVIVINDGKMLIDSTPEMAVNVYNEVIADLDENYQLPHQDTEQHFGNNKAQIIEATLQGLDSQAQVISSGEKMRIEFLLTAHEMIDNATLGFVIRDRFGQDIYGINSYHLKQPLDLSINETRKVIFTVLMDLAPGKYTLSAALHSQENHLDDCYFWQDNILKFEIAGIKEHIFAGLCKMPTELLIE